MFSVSGVFRERVLEGVSISADGAQRPCSHQSRIRTTSPTAQITMRQISRNIREEDSQGPWVYLLEDDDSVLVESIQ